MNKLEKRALKLATHQQVPDAPITGPIDCACVIHGDAYDWTYVERLYNMLCRNISPGVRMHVYTEAERTVPSPMFKHVLTDWGIGGPKKGWWYKMQLFNSQHHSGPLLYFDLDVVITGNLDWIWQLPLRHFWAVRDFKHLWRPTNYDVNSSVMWWNTAKFDWVWQKFQKEKLDLLVRQYHGDQNYISEQIQNKDLRFFDTARVKSWRWQCLDGGYDFRYKNYLCPGQGTSVDARTSVLIFHGKPKPKDVMDGYIVEHWK